jgi:ferric-dicitrate binding protein FerR (iron transport regulator)
MEEVLKDMEEYFGEEVSVTDEAILSCKFTSTFSEPEIGEVLEVVSLTLDLSVEETGEAYILGGTGCTEHQK